MSAPRNAGFGRISPQEPRNEPEGTTGPPEPHVDVEAVLVTRDLGRWGWHPTRRRVRVGYECQPGRITYWSTFEFTTITAARRWANRLNRHHLPGRWVVRA